MENTNKMKNLANDLKAFEQMMKEQRKENSYPEFEFEIDTEEDSPADILFEAADVLMDCAEMVSSAAFLVSIMHDQEQERTRSYDQDQGRTRGLEQDHAYDEES